MSAYENVVAVTGLTYDGNGEVQEYLAKALTALNDLPEEEWEGLDDSVKTWFNDSAKQMQDPENENPLNLIPGMDEVKPAKKRGRPRNPNAAPKEKKTSARRSSEGSATANLIRKLLCENMEYTMDQVIEKLEAQGIETKKSYVQVIYLNTARAFEVAKEVGTVHSNGTLVLTKAE